MMPASNSHSIITRKSNAERITFSSSAQSRNCRSVIRKLLERYTKEEISKLIEEESSFISKDSAPPGLHSSQDDDNAFPALLSSDRIKVTVAPLIHSGNQLQNHACKPTPSLNIVVPFEETRQRNDARTAFFLPVTQQLPFTCGFCAEESITKTCTRRNDLRRHIESFHNGNAMWSCQHPGCRMAFDWRAAYQSHLCNAHGGSHMNMADALVKLCPQVVFACGFENCSQCFEATSDDEISAILKEYSHHIVKHFGEGLDGGRWTYSARIHNLLRQSQVLPAWDMSLPEPERSRLRWEPQTSLTIRKLLETRHLDKLPSLIHFAIVLGSGSSLEKGIVSGLELPFKVTCDYNHATSPNIREAPTRAYGEKDSHFRRLHRGTSDRAIGDMLPIKYLPPSDEP